MPPKDYVKSESKVYLDGKEITNFFTNEVQVIKQSDAEGSEIQKWYEFESTITLTGKQAKRFIKAMVKAERKWKIQRLKAKLKLTFQKMFKVVADLFKIK